MHVVTVLNLLERMERAVGRLYRRYAEDLVHDRDASTFFFRFALEKGQHASIIRYQRNVAWQNPKHFSPSLLDLKEVATVIRRAEELVSSPEIPTLEEAIAVAAEFESGAGAVHSRFAVQPSDPSFTKLVSRLGKADKIHAEQVAEFAFQRGLCLCMNSAKPHPVAASA